MLRKMFLIIAVVKTTSLEYNVPKPQKKNSIYLTE